MNKNVKFIAAALLLAGSGIFAFQHFNKAEAGNTVAAIAPAAGDEGKATGAPQVAWAVRCNEEDDAKKEKKPAACEMYQRQDMKESGQRVIEFAIGYPEDKAEARGVFVLPTGILLEQGVKLKVDENTPMQFQVRYCVPNGCMAFVNLNDDLLATFSKGSKAFVEIYAMDGKPITLTLPLNGFADALKKIKG